MNNEGINATLLQSVFGDADIDASITPTQEELDALAAVQHTIDGLDIPTQDKNNLAESITRLLELLRQREQRIFDAGSELAFQVCKRMIETGAIYNDDV